MQDLPFRGVAVGLGFRDEPSGVVDGSGGVGQPKEVKVRISDATEYKIDLGDFPMCRGLRRPFTAENNLVVMIVGLTQTLYCKAAEL